MLFSNPHRDSIADLIQTMGDALSFIKEAKKVGVELTQVIKSEHKDGSYQLKLGKLTLGVDYALDQTLHHSKTNMADMGKHARSILTILQEKRCEVPHYLNNLLHDMSKKGAAAEVKASAAEAAAAAKPTQKCS